jgi:hypothetical protein
MLPSERLEPRISVNDLALFMVSSDTARISIIRRTKFPKPPPIIRYRDVRAPVVAYLSDIRRDVQVLLAAECMFSQRTQDSSLGPLRQDDARQSIEVIRSLQAMQNKIGAFRFSEASQEQPQLQVSGVIVSVRLDLLVHGASRGTNQIGGAILRFTQDDADTEGAKSRRRDMGMYVAALARMHLERNFTFDAPIANRLCMSIDIRHGECFASAASNARRVSDIENACRFIAATWPSVEPYPSTK